MSLAAIILSTIAIILSLLALLDGDELRREVRDNRIDDCRWWARAIWGDRDATRDGKEKTK